MYIQLFCKDQFCKIKIQFVISVFVTNAKGGDCWHFVMFAISDNTYLFCMHTGLNTLLAMFTVHFLKLPSQHTVVQYLSTLPSTE